jgi:dTDP-4-dehydrorhamnose 3,5-epimerase
MKFFPTPIADLFVVHTTPHTESRGAFSRLYCELESSSLIGDRRIVQINHSRTTNVGAVRGLHFQYPPYAEIKFVRCIKGRVWDVAVDLRSKSPTFLDWHAEELSPLNDRMMVIPEGVAHGFQVLEPESELLYLHTAFYTPGAEGGLRFSDPRLAINWPLPVTEASQRDKSHPLIDSNFIGITTNEM